jgi:4-carboxymuconolactone decarboxylase
MSTADGRLSDGSGERRGLPLGRPDRLSEAQRPLYASIAGGRRGHGPQLFRIVGGNGELLGPFGVMLLHPPVGGPLQALGAALRYDGCLSPGAREIVICSVAAARRSSFEWYAHAAVARSIGIPEDVLDSVWRGDPPRELSTEEAAAWQLATAVLSGEPVEQPQFADACAELQASGVMEVVTLVGYYRLLADLMAVFDVDHVPVENGAHPAHEKTCVTNRDGSSRP